MHKKSIGQSRSKQNRNSRFSLYLLCVLTLLASLHCSAVLSAIDADAIVEKADAFRGFKGAFASETKLRYYKKGNLESEQSLKVYVQNGTNSLVKFKGPGKEKGRIMLMSGNNVWIYIPKTKNPIRLTPQQRLLGQASNGDVARTNYSEDYAAKLLGEESVNEHRCYKLQLDAKEKGTTYQKIVYYVEKGSHKPVKALFYAKSGKLLKEGYFRSPKKFMGRTILSELHLIDRLKKEEETTISTTALSKEKLPSQYFNKNYLKRIK